MRTASEVLRSLEARIARLEGRTASSKRSASLTAPHRKSASHNDMDYKVWTYDLMFTLYQEGSILSDDELEKMLRASVNDLTKIFDEKVYIEDYMDGRLSCGISNLDLESVHRIMKYVDRFAVGPYTIETRRGSGVYANGFVLLDDNSGRRVAEGDELMDLLERWA